MQGWLHACPAGPIHPPTCDMPTLPAQQSTALRVSGVLSLARVMVRPCPRSTSASKQHSKLRRHVCKAGAIMQLCMQLCCSKTPHKHACLVHSQQSLMLVRSLSATTLMPQLVQASRFQPGFQAFTHRCTAFNVVSLGSGSTRPWPGGTPAASKGAQRLISRAHCAAGCSLQAVGTWRLLDSAGAWHPCQACLTAGALACAARALCCHSPRAAAACAAAYATSIELSNCTWLRCTARCITCDDAVAWPRHCKSAATASSAIAN